MADIQQAIRRLSIEATEKGVDEVTAKLKELGKAQGDVAVASAQTEKASLSLDSRFASLERRFVSTIRQQQDYEKIQRDVNLAVQQNPQLQDRANAVLAAAAVRYDQVGIAARATAAATQGVNLQLVALAGGSGPVGTFLAALGPWGFAAAVGLGAASKAFSSMTASADALASKARALRDFADVTGLTTNEVQALRSEASKFGVSADDAQSAIQNFTARFDQLRNGQGELLTQIRRVNPALADQMAGANNASDALTMFGKALQDVDNIFQRNALVKAATGRGGLSAAQFLTGLDVAAVSAKYKATLTDPMIAELQRLSIEVDKTTKKAQDNFASIYSVQVLQAQKGFAEGLLKVSEWAKSFSLSGDLKLLLTALAAAVPGVGPMLNLGASIFSGLSSAGEKATFSDRFKPANDNPLAPYQAPTRITITPNQDVMDRYNAAKLRDQISAMGDAATAADKLKLAQLQLAIAGKEAGLSQDQLARSAGLLNEAFNNQRIQAAVSALGSAATVTEQFAAKVANLKLEMDKGNISQETYNRAVAGLKNDQYIQSLQDTISALGDVAPLTKQYELRVAELQQMLDQGRISQETFNEAVKAADPAFKAARDAQNSFGQDLLSSLMQGKGAFESLTGAASKYISTLANATLNRVQNGGNLFGNQNLASVGGLGTVASAGLSGYQSGSPLGGALSGALAGATFGPVGAVVGGLAGLAGGIFGADAQKKAAEEAHRKEVEAAKDAWAKMEGQWKQWLGSITGHNVGSVQASLDAAYQQMSDYVAAIAKAKDLHGGDAQPQEITDTMAAFNEAQHRAIAEFIGSWVSTIDNLTNGIGPDSPFAKAVSDVKDIAAQVEGYVSDTRLFFAQGLDQTIAAARSYLLTLLDTPPALSATQEAIQTLNGKAQALQQALVDLGMSSDEAASAIAGKLTGAMDKLRSDFTDNLQRSFNDASGKGYINDIADAVKQHQQDLADSAALGLSGSLADQVLQAQIQKIVDGSGLVGDAFAQLSSKFPDLVGVMTDTADSIQAIIDGLKIGDKSILSPQEKLAAAQDLYNRDYAKASGGDASAMSALTSDIDSLLSIAKDFYSSTAGYVDIYNTVIGQLTDLQTKSTFANGGLVGSYAGGGVVGNGAWNIDSVRARYAGGGDIMLAGGEFVNRASSVNASTMPFLDHINRTGNVPANDNGSRQNFVDLMRQNTAGFTAVVTALREEVGELRATIERQGRQNAQLLNKPDRPGAKKAANG